MIPIVPLQVASTTPAGEVAWELSAGFSLLNFGIPSVPVLPILTGGIAAEVGVSDHVDLGVRYTTWLGFDHRLGPEVQLGIPVGDRGGLGVRVHPWVRIAGSATDGVELGGDVALQPALVGSLAVGDVVFTLDVGTTVQLVLFERLAGTGFADGRPWLATVDVAGEFAWSSPWAKALALRLELGIPRAPDDPLSIGPFRPKLVFSAHFAGGRRVSGSGLSEDREAH